MARAISKYSVPGVFGDLEVEQDTVAKFQGEEGGRQGGGVEGEEGQEGLKEGEERRGEGVVSYDVPLAILELGGWEGAVGRMKEGRREMEELVQEIVSRVGGQEIVHRVEGQEQEEQKEQQEQQHKEQDEQDEQEEEQDQEDEEQEEQEQGIAVTRVSQWDCYTQVQCSLV